MIILFARELHKRYHADGIATAAFHPGVVRTNLGAEFRSNTNRLFSAFMNILFISPAKGADTLEWLATAQPGKDWQSGEYYSKRKIKSISKQARNARLAHDLWELSAKLTELK
jgi:NAD(P)-dependent dehydrogenase (short-subunit alcohol dehydrogenase family)